MLNVSDFNLFSCENCNPPPLKKNNPPLSQQFPSIIWGPVKPLLFENLVAGSTPLPPAEREGGCPLCYCNRLTFFKVDIFVARLETILSFSCCSLCSSFGNFEYDPRPGKNKQKSKWIFLIDKENGFVKS